MDSLIINIIKFLDVLRLAGVRVSLAETIDVLQALEHVNILDKSGVRAAMSACLAKSEEERKLFSEAFERFFVEAGEREKYVNGKIGEMEQKRQKIDEKASELKFQEENLELTDELKEVYAGLSEEERRSIVQFLERTSSGKNVRPDFKRVAEAMVKGKLYNAKDRIDAFGESLWEAPVQVASEAGVIAGDAASAVRRENSLLYKNISDIRDEDIPAVIKLIKSIVERLKRNISRRYKRTNKKARPDLKKTLRSNLSSGGVQFHLKYKTKPKRKERILVLCDVSASMFRFSGFVLQFILGMHESFSSTDSYIFSDDIEHLNLGGFLNLSDFELQVRRSSVWKKGTNINEALKHILKYGGSAVNSSTIVLLVSDAKTLEHEKVIKKLSILESKVKRILWLNPIPEKDWARIKGIEGFREYSTVLECSTLQRLAKACSIL